MEKISSILHKKSTLLFLFYIITFTKYPYQFIYFTRLFNKIFIIHQFFNNFPNGYTFFNLNLYFKYITNTSGSANGPVCGGGLTAHWIGVSNHCTAITSGLIVVIVAPTTATKLMSLTTVLLELVIELPE